MRVALPLFFIAAVLMMSPSCASSRRSSCITEISDLPLKTAEKPGDSWEASPLRANANYILHGAKSKRQREERIGDYYYVSWYDAQPDQPASLVMHYTQAKTASKVLVCRVDAPVPRKAKGYRKARFFFAGEERKLKGDILSWRMDLYVGGRLVDSRQSYLWE